MPEPESYTSHRPMRIDDALWDAVGEVVGPRNRSTLVRDLLRWWLRIPGAKMPPRPERPPVIDHRPPRRSPGDG